MTSPDCAPFVQLRPNRAEIFDMNKETEQVQREEKAARIRRELRNVVNPDFARRRGIFALAR